MGRRQVVDPVFVGPGGPPCLRHALGSSRILFIFAAAAVCSCHKRHDGGAMPVTVRVSVDSAGAQAAGGGSYDPSISSDGRYVAFDSNATNLVPGDTNGFTDVFVRGPLF